MGWRGVAYALLRPILFRFDSERIHRLTLDALRLSGGNPAGRALAAFLGGVRDERPVELAGIAFRNRIGVGAGFDKDGVALPGWAALGLGFAEVGTVTPLPQAGNPRPRLFRLPADEALVNRMGFNNAGALAVARNVMLARRHLPAGFVVGVNIGCNRETPSERIVDDYLAAHRLVAPVADYLAINVSSPNTPGLRDLQQPDAPARAGPRHPPGGRGFGHPPPPLRQAGARPRRRMPSCGLIEQLMEDGVAGVIMSNTTTARDALRSPMPLAERVRRAVRCAAAATHDRGGAQRAGRCPRSTRDHGQRRHPQRGGCGPHAGCRSRPVAAVDRPGLPRTGSDRCCGGRRLIR